MARLSRLSNALTTLGIVVIVGLVVEQRWTQYREAGTRRAIIAENTYQRGQLIHDTPELRLKESQRTLLIGTASTCRFCTASMPFYNRLLDVAKGQGVNVVAYTVENLDRNRQYLDAHGVAPDAVVGAIENRLLLYSTPTIVLVRRDGTVVKSWLGQLTPSEEDELIRLLEENVQ
jgi:hypothetical protein